MLKILYLHGLNSQLHTDRQKVLEKYFAHITAPKIDYENNPEILNEFLNQKRSYDIIIGSSAGGLLGFYLANQWQIPSLLFNPALPFAWEIPNLPNIQHQTSLMQICIGWQDEVVPAQESLKFIQEKFSKPSKIHINIRKDMAHTVPINWFKQEVKSFFEIKNNLKLI